MDQEPKTPPKLRRKPPFFCPHTDQSGKHDHLDYALAETDGKLCPQHDAEQKAAHDRFWKAPPRAETSVTPYTGPAIWPQ